MRGAKEKTLRLAGAVLVVASGLSGCWRPVNELGTVHTPMPTAVGAEHQAPLSPETLQGLVIPRPCVHEMPMGIFGITTIDLSPDGEWLVGRGRTRFSLGTPHPFVFLHHLETRESRILPRSVTTDTMGELDYGGVSFSWDGQMSGLYYLDSGEGRDELYHLRLSDGWVRGVEDCADCGSVDVDEPLGLAAYIRVGQGERGKQWWLEVRRWNKGVSAGVLVTVPVPSESHTVKLSPTGKRASYMGEQVEIEDERGYEWPVRLRHYVDLATGTMIKLNENYLRDPWVTDDVVLEPDREMPWVWKYDLVTGRRELFVEFAPGALLFDEEEQREGKRYAIRSAMIGGRHRQYLLFEWRHARGPSYGTLMVADLRCALQQGQEK